MKTLLSALFILLTVIVFARQMPDRRTDIATTDFTTIAGVVAADLSFRGLCLGMSKEEAIQKLNSFKDLNWKFDDFNTTSKSTESFSQMSISVDVNSKAESGDPVALYLQWEDGIPGLNAIVFYKALSPLLAGNAKKLFTPDALDGSCDCRKFLNSELQKETDEIGITTYHLPKQHFSLIYMMEPGNKEQIWFKFMQ
jgi:hypothetical protein